MTVNTVFTVVYLERNSTLSVSFFTDFKFSRVGIGFGIGGSGVIILIDIFNLTLILLENYPFIKEISLF